MNNALKLFVCLAAAAVAARGQEVKRPAITGIAFARLYTTDAAGAERFYGKTLGYEKRVVDGVWVYPVNRSQWIEVVPATPAKETVRMLAVGLTTRDAKGMERYLAAHGVKAEIPLKGGEFGVRDPEGNLVIFVQAGSEKVVAGAPASAAAASRRMIHAGFLVRDRAKEDAFWRDLVGLTPYWHGGRTDASTDYVAQQVPEGTDWIEYMLNAGEAPTLKQMGGMDHISLGTARMSDVVAALARNGCEGPNCAKTQSGRDGKVQLNLFDPDFSRVEFMEFTPAKEPCCSPFMGRQPGEMEDE